MKRFLFLAAIISAFACNDKAEPGNKSQLTNLKDWEIDAGIAKKMAEHLTPGTNTHKDNLEIVVANLPVLNAIIRKFPKSEIVLVPARYKDNTDVERYRTRRHITDPEEYAVKDYVTLLYKIPSNGKDVIADVYYDAISICPPPYPCRNRLQLDTLRY